MSRTTPQRKQLQPMALWRARPKKPWNTFETVVLFLRGQASLVWESLAQAGTTLSPKSYFLFSPPPIPHNTIPKDQTRSQLAAGKSKLEGKGAISSSRLWASPQASPAILARGRRQDKSSHCLCCKLLEQCQHGGREGGTAGGGGVSFEVWAVESLV